MRCLIFISAMVLVFCSCADDTATTLQAFRTSEQGLRSSTETINYSNSQVYKALDDRLHDRTYYRADIWQPKAMQVKEISDDMAQYINKLKTDLKTASGIYKKGDLEFYNESNSKAVDDLIKINGKELFSRLITYRKDILSVDSMLQNQFEKILRLFSPQFDYLNTNADEFTKVFFKGIPSVGAMAILAKFENDTRVNENMFITYCLNQISHLYCGFSILRPLVHQNSNCLKSGDNLIITAGIGSYTCQTSPIILIDGKNVTVDADGAAVHKFKVPQKAGNYSKEVKIEFTKPDGTKEWATRNVEYTVIDPKQTQ